MSVFCQRFAAKLAVILHKLAVILHVVVFVLLLLSVLLLLLCYFIFLTLSFHSRSHNSFRREKFLTCLAQVYLSATHKQVGGGWRCFVVGKKYHCRQARACMHTASAKLLPNQKSETHYDDEIHEVSFPSHATNSEPWHMPLLCSKHAKAKIAQIQSTLETRTPVHTATTAMATTAVAGIFAPTSLPNQRPLCFVLNGPTNAGKTTQCKILCASTGLIHLSTGDIFRKAMAEQTELGEQVKVYIDRGDMVPDSLVISHIISR